jgi:hypothetical protein
MQKVFVCDACRRYLSATHAEGICLRRMPFTLSDCFVLLHVELLLLCHSDVDTVLDVCELTRPVQLVNQPQVGVLGPVWWRRRNSTDCDCTRIRASASLSGVCVCVCVCVRACVYACVCECVGMRARVGRLVQVTVCVKAWRDSCIDSATNHHRSGALVAPVPRPLKNESVTGSSSHSHDVVEQHEVSLKVCARCDSHDVGRGPARCECPVALVPGVRTE